MSTPRLDRRVRRARVPTGLRWRRGATPKTWLVAASCRVYGLAIQLYPEPFRREFGAEMRWVFREQLEAVLRDGDRWQQLRFPLRIAVDWLQTRATVTSDVQHHASTSILGLVDGCPATGSVRQASLDAALVFASAGLVVGAAGWYWYLILLPPLVHI